MAGDRRLVLNFRAYCTVCYTSTLHEGTKRDCERACTGHMNAYGHDVGIMQISDRQVISRRKPSAHKETDR